MRGRVCSGELQDECVAKDKQAKAPQKVFALPQPQLTLGLGVDAWDVG